MLSSSDIFREYCLYLVPPLYEVGRGLGGGDKAKSSRRVIYHLLTID
jgi:hypothetical protein